MPLPTRTTRLAASLVAGVLTLGLAAPAQAAPTRIASTGDPQGDVVFAQTGEQFAGFGDDIRRVTGQHLKRRGKVAVRIKYDGLTRKNTGRLWTHQAQVKVGDRVRWVLTYRPGEKHAQVATPAGKVLKMRVLNRANLRKDLVVFVLPRRRFGKATVAQAQASMFSVDRSGQGQTMDETRLTPQFSLR